MTYLFDTNAILYELKGISKPIKFKKSDSICCSFITKIELLSYKEMPKQEMSIIKSLLSSIEVLYIDNDIVQKSISVRKKSKLKLPDAIICATALHKKAVLVTADKQLLKTSDQIGVNIKNALY